MSLQYTIFNNPDGTGNASLFHNGRLYTATNEHLKWNEIRKALTENDESVVDLFDPSIEVSRRFEPLGERVSVSNGRVYFDGDEVDNSLTRQILSFLRDDVDDWSPLVNFWERLAANPNPHSVEQLYRWLNVQDITINEDGMIVGYKGVERVPGEPDDTYQSVNSGTAVVDGVTHTGKIPNYLGAVVTMPRSQVEFDPANGCSTGLHVGTWKYADGWARGAVLLVEVDPRDVVSVPTDCNSEKLRVCRYTVMGVTDQELTSAVYGDSVYDDYDDEEYYEDDCAASDYCPCGACGF